jgi:hypothetical protein
MKIIPNRFRLILYCTLFNLLFEYSARGINEFIHRPLFVLVLFGIYFTYFTILEDLILRFKLKNYQIFLVAFLYGLFPTAFLTGNLFNETVYFGILFSGINLGTLVMIGIFAWGFMQGIVTLYFANRLTPRDWNHPRMGKIGWILVILYQVFVMIAAHRNPVTPRGTLPGYLALGALIIISTILFIYSLRNQRQEVQPFQSSIIMDFLTFGSVILFLILGTLFISGETIITSQPLNKIAVTIENIWVFLCGIVFFLYRLLKGSDVTV